jgi:hypothetical protein
MYVVGTVVQSTPQFIYFFNFYFHLFLQFGSPLFRVLSEITLNVIFRSSLNMFRLTSIECM